jgi:ferredoxin-NADP reductase
MRLRVVDIVRETPTAKTFRLERSDGELPPFRPGQYINVFVDVDGVLTSRPYSIASPPLLPAENKCAVLELTVRDNPGGFVAPYLLHEVQVGDEIETTGPTGGFYHEPLIDGHDLVFLAGGSGITPFRSIILDNIRRECPLGIHLLYGSRAPDDVIYGDELAELANDHASLCYALVISEPPLGYVGDSRAGFLDAKLVRDEVGSVEGKTFYICGPNVMVDFVLAELEELRVPPHKIRREFYGAPADVTKEPGWPRGLPAGTVFNVEVAGKRTVRAPAGEPLLNSLERYGLLVPAVCRSGACSACRLRLVSGRVYMPSDTGLRESDRRHGYIHACVSYPLEDLRIRL